MRSLLTIILISFYIPFSVAQTTGKKNYFAVGLFAGAHSSMITYAVVSYRDGQFLGAQVLTEQQFMYQALGYYPSIANINKENLFAKNGVDSCFLIKNDLNKIVGYYNKPFWDLWKIRFYENPIQFDMRGWSQGQYKPSIYQMKILKESYGVNNVLTDYFYGDTLYKLLRDVQNPVWVESYKFAEADTSTTANNTGQP
ncbi:MAG: hypothetical protein JNJ99_09225 [Crocinitomicaceae bacterium]|nr:hypothetical protein [Crocinitomicaceae bacterium]